MEEFVPRWPLLPLEVLVSELVRDSRGRRRTVPPGRDDRGVKNLPNRLGVTEGFRRSLPRLAREGER